MGEVWAVVKWWFWLEVIAAAAWPLAWRLFEPFPDRGTAFAKPLGLLLWGYILWLGATLGVLPNTLGGALAAILLLAALSAYSARAALEADARGSRPLLAWLRAHWRRVIVVEGLFSVAFGMWALVRAQSPDITPAGGEKFMEIAFLNGILTSRRFPPHDPWLAGYAISYYYFGYVMVAGLIRLAHVPASVGFNVGFASWFALTFVAAFGLGWAWAARGLPGEPKARPGTAALWGLLTSIVVALMGNLEGFLEVLYARQVLPVAFWQWLDIRNINRPYDPSVPASWIPQRFIWWWQASRVIHDRDLLGNTMEVIDEFPAFSFILGDMHPHVLVLPFTLLTLAWVFSVYFDGEHDLRRGVVYELGRWRVVLPFSPAVTALTALMLGGLAFLNTWDFPIYWALLVAVLWLRAAREAGGLTWTGLSRALQEAAVVAALGFGAYLPFYFGFQSQASGVLPNLFNPTRWPQFTVMFGPQLVLLALLWWQAGRVRRWRPLIRMTIGVWVLPWLVVGLLVGGYFLLPAGQAFLQQMFANPVVQENVAGRTLPELFAFVARRRLLNPWTALILGFLLAWTLVQIWERAHRSPGHRQGERADLTFALLLVALGLLLTYAVEFVYIRDLFGTRMNTVFKFYYQAWLLWSLAGVHALALWSRRASYGSRAVGLTAAAVVIGLGLLYTALAIPARSTLRYTAPTLDGEAWIAQRYPDDYALIQWVREHTRPADVVLEAPGGSYTFFGRVAAFTGRPTLMGWAFHEWQWRGAALASQAGTREADVERIYTRARGAELLRLLHEYQVSYVVVGTTEREKYRLSSSREEVLNQVLEKVWEQGAARIYRVP